MKNKRLIICRERTLNIAEESKKDGSAEMFCSGRLLWGVLQRFIKHFLARANFCSSSCHLEKADKFLSFCSLSLYGLTCDHKGCLYRLACTCRLQTGHVSAAAGPSTCITSTEKQHEFADNFWKDVKVGPLCEVEGVRQVFVAAVPGRNG